MICALLRHVWQVADAVDICLEDVCLVAAVINNVRQAAEGAATTAGATAPTASAATPTMGAGAAKAELQMPSKRAGMCAKEGAGEADTAAAPPPTRTRKSRCHSQTTPLAPWNKGGLLMRLLAHVASLNCSGPYRHL